MSQHIRILVASPTPEGTLEQLREVSDRIEVIAPPGLVPFSRPEYDAELTRHLIETPSDILFAPRLPKTWEPDGRLKWAQIASAGTDAEHGKPIWRDPSVQLTTAAGIHGAPISEWVCAMLLLHSQNILAATAWKAERTWPKAKGQLGGSVLLGKTLGVIGYGAIGRESARLGRALGMRVVAFNRTGTLDSWATRYNAPSLGQRLSMDESEVELRSADQLDAFLPECDYLVIAAGLNASTHHVIGPEQLRRMKPESFLINIARGGLIDEPALIDALTSGQIGGAALDVFDPEPPAEDNPLFDLPNVVMTPHVAGAHREYYESAHALFRDNLRRFLANEPLFNTVDRSVDA